MDVMQMQFLFMGMIFLLTTGVGLAPVALRGALSKRLVPRAAVRSRLLSCASCFGAGVFIFVCFMGLLPAADRKFHHFLEVHAMEHSRGEADSNATHILLTKSSVGSATQRATGGDAEVREDTNDHDHCKDYHGEGHGVPSSVIFLMALGIHSLFEGMAVGLQTQKDKVLEFSVAVLVHETVMAFTFGMEVSNSHVLSRWTKALYVLIFTTTIPLGIAAGVGLQNAPSDNREIVSAVLEAFATGIFIHVIFIEVLAKEFPGHHQHHHHKDIDSDPKSSSPPSETCLMLEKVSCICCGLVTLILINVFMHAHH